MPLPILEAQSVALFQNTVLVKPCLAGAEPPGLAHTEPRHPHPCEGAHH